MWRLWPRRDSNQRAWLAVLANPPLRWGAIARTPRERFLCGLFATPDPFRAGHGGEPLCPGGFCLTQVAPLINERFQQEQALAPTSRAGPADHSLRGKTQLKRGAGRNTEIPTNRILEKTKKPPSGDCLKSEAGHVDALIAAIWLVFLRIFRISKFAA